MLTFTSLADVQSHCKEKGKLYCVHHGSVLDVAEFKHPGPQALISSNIGADISKAFDDRSHSNFAKELCDRMTIGYIGNESNGQVMSKAIETMSSEEAEIQKRLDEKIDISKPLMPQVARLSNKEFMTFVRRPRYIKDTDGIQLYEDKGFDESVKTHYDQNLMYMTPVVVSFVAASFFCSGSAVEFSSNFFVYFVLLGIGVMWTFTEYYFHRFLLHKEITLDPNGPADGQYLMKCFASHLQHHVFMNQKYRVVLGMEAYKIYSCAAFVIMQLFLPRQIAFMLEAGWIFGSLLYDGFHYSFHHGPDLHFAWYQKMKAAHMRHHFRDNSIEFGVTTPIWDHILGTASVLKKD